MSRSSSPRYIEITDAESGLTGFWDQDADVALVQFIKKHVARSQLVDDRRKILGFDDAGNLASIQSCIAGTDQYAGCAGGGTEPDPRGGSCSGHRTQGGLSAAVRPRAMLMR